MDSGKLSVALEEADVIAAFRLHGRRSRESRLSYMIMSAVALGLGGWILASPKFPGFMNILAAIAIASVAGWWLMTLATILLLPAKLRRRILKRGAKLGSYDLEWNDEAFIFQSPDSQSRRLWGELVKWRQNKQVFLVYFTNRLFWIVPKRLFRDEDECRGFEALLKGGIGRENRPRLPG